MGNIHVLKRADAIIRWVERLKKSYADGDTSNAYIEAECARADIEALTHDVIAGLSHTPKRTVIFPALRVILLSLAVVMSWTLPISREVVEREAVAVKDYPLPGMAKPIAVEPRVVPTKPNRQKANTPKTTPTKAQPMLKTAKPTKPTTPSPVPTKAPAYDRLAYLTLTGQKALNNDNTTIKLTGRGNKNL